MGTYKNAMEVLVAEEVQRQFQSVSPRMAAYVNPTELLAFALNQLPALYATSESGLEHQLQRGRAQFKEQITQAVRRAFAAISRDPIRHATPLEEEAKPAFLEETLRQLRRLLRNDQLQWEMLPAALEQALSPITHDRTPWGKPASVGGEFNSNEYERARQARQRIARWKNRFY